MTDPSTPKQIDQETIARLAALSPLQYDRVRKEEAEKLNVRPATLDAQVKAARKSQANDHSNFEDIIPCVDPVDPAQLLTTIANTILRFIVCSEHVANAAALWIAMTWFMDVIFVAPLAVITAPEKRCGKSQLLSLMGRLVKRPLQASNISPAALFRSIDAWQPTLVVDEADSFMKDNEELRGILNAGHTRDSAYVVRVVGEDHQPKCFNVWGAKVIAGIGRLQDTVMDRSIVLELRRKLPHEKVNRLRHTELDLFAELTPKLARFAEDCREAVRSARPALPEVLHDRAQDNWEALLAIADVAGGPWPKLARVAAIQLTASPGDSTENIGTQLLSDIRDAFESKNADKISTADLIAYLCIDEERPWATYNRGKPIVPRQIGTRLDQYGICSKTIRVGYGTCKGFDRSQFDDVFARYLPPLENCRHTSQCSSDAGFGVTDDWGDFCSTNKSETAKTASNQACDGVTDNFTDEDWEERASIHEYEADMTREDAEKLAKKG